MKEPKSNATVVTAQGVSATGNFSAALQRFIVSSPTYWDTFWKKYENPKNGNYSEDGRREGSSQVVGPIQTSKE